MQQSTRSPLNDNYCGCLQCVHASALEGFASENCLRVMRENRRLHCGRCIGNVCMCVCVTESDSRSMCACTAGGPLKLLTAHTHTCAGALSRQSQATTTRAAPPLRHPLALYTSLPKAVISRIGRISSRRTGINKRSMTIGKKSSQEMQTFSYRLLFSLSVLSLEVKEHLCFLSIFRFHNRQRLEMSE